MPTRFDRHYEDPACLDPPDCPDAAARGQCGAAVGARRCQPSADQQPNRLKNQTSPAHRAHQYHVHGDHAEDPSYVDLGEWMVLPGGERGPGTGTVADRLEA